MQERRPSRRRLLVVVGLTLAAFIAADASGGSTRPRVAPLAVPPGTDVSTSEVTTSSRPPMQPADATVPLLDQGSIQFMLFGVMVLVVVFLLWVTIAK